MQLVLSVWLAVHASSGGLCVHGLLTRGGGACALARRTNLNFVSPRRLLLAGVVGVLPVARLGDLATLLGVMIKAWGQQVGGAYDW
jgi:hypothetical protein